MRISKILLTQLLWKYIVNFFEKLITLYLLNYTLFYTYPLNYYPRNSCPLNDESANLLLQIITHVTLIYISSHR